MRKIALGSKIFTLLGDLLASLRVEVVGIFASIELGSKPVRVEISTAESGVLRSLAIKSHTWPSKCFHISIILHGHRATIGLVTVTDMGMSAEWRGERIEDQWPLVLCYRNVPAKETNC